MEYVRFPLEESVSIVRVDAVFALYHKFYSRQLSMRGFIILRHIMQKEGRRGSFKDHFW